MKGVNANRKTGRKRRAAILVLTLWIVVVLGIISASMLQEIYLELKLTKYQHDDFEAMVLARAGVARAIADLRNDLMMDHAGKGQAFDALGDVWARQDEDKIGRDNEGVKMGRGTYRVWVEDEASKFNLNMATPPVLKAALYELGLEEKEAQAITSAIADWMDPDDIAQPPGVGNEDEYYSTIMAKQTGSRWDKDEPPIYRCKNDRFSSLEELLSVAGVTPELFYGIDPEKETLPNPIEQFKKRIEYVRTPSPREEHFGLRDIFTVYSPGPINVNTADRRVLRILFRAAGADASLAAGCAERIVQLRKPDARGISNNEKAFRNPMEITKAGVPAYLMPRVMTATPLTIQSNIYRIYALGEIKEAQHLICGVVSRNPETCNPDTLNPLFDRGIVPARLVQAFRRRHRDRREPFEQISVRVIQWQEL